MREIKDSAELQEQIRDIIDHIDNPYSHFGLGVEHEGYGKASATDAIVQRAEAYTAAQVAKIIGKNDVYTELDYSQYENDDDTSWSKRQVKESRKQRMARVVFRNELRAEQRKYLAQLTTQQEEEKR